MKRQIPVQGATRRTAITSTLAGLTAARLSASGPDHPVTSASVPDDPDAPAPQKGTLPQRPAFTGNEQFLPAEFSPEVVPFDLQNVQLLPGPFLEAQQADRRFLLAMPVERLAHTFRLNAGLPSAAAPLGGWEKPDGELRGHFTGHFLSASALMYRSTGDAELKAKADALVNDLAACQNRLRNGYLSAFPIEFFDRLQNRKPVWAPFYTVHKIMAGLLDMYSYGGNRQALEVVTRMAEWTDTWSAPLSSARMQMVLDTEFGGMAETLYNLSAVTGDSRWGRAGDRFIKQRFLNPLAARQDLLRGLHANTHIPQIVAAARRYELTRDNSSREASRFFLNTVIETRTYASGGTSNNEGWLVGPNQLAAELAQGTATNECCCAYNMLKLTRKLYGWSPDPSLFDYYERVLLNHRLGTIDLRTGYTQYYLGIAAGSWRTFGTEFDSFWCCNGTGVEEYAKLQDSIYFHDGDGLYVNLFVPSSLSWSEKGVRLRQETRFPDEQASTLKIEVDQPAALTIHLRIPGWLRSAPAIRINGQLADGSARPGSYASLRRTWKSGDQVNIELPFSLRAEAMPDDPKLQAFLYGPLLLAGTLSDPVPAELIRNHMGPDFKKAPALPSPTLQRPAVPLDRFIQSGSAPLRFEVPAASGKLLLAPFWQISDDRYSVYWRVTPA